MSETFFERLRAKGASARAALSAEVSKFRNQTFLDAVIAACAMIAAADGNVSSDEKQKMVAFLKRSDELKHFDTTKVIASFNKFIEGFEFDQIIGRGEALKAIAQLKGKDDQARLLVRVACAIGASDGDFDDDEKATVRDICKELNLDAQEFGV
ncbi:tellurite resistance TerB family protein [Pseudovibrio ascidiaceicola]|uniref:tellurite resistance TerB family protein n=1 Tax=Pseudovibrio ascidiaceicola TaxID=285279 RepID=UPI003D3606E9